jgi:hypothetical protein
LSYVRKRGLGPDRECGEGFASDGVDGCEYVGGVAGEPDEAFRVERVGGAGRHGNFLANGVGGGIDAQERAGGIGDDPDGVVAGGDAAFVVGWAERESGDDFVVGRPDAGERCRLAAERDPESVESEDQAGAGFVGKLDSCGDGVAVDGDAVDSFERALET